MFKRILSEKEDEDSSREKDIAGGKKKNVRYVATFFSTNVPKNY